MKELLALIWVNFFSILRVFCGAKVLTGTTYSCVANYEGTNVEISMLHIVTIWVAR